MMTNSLLNVTSARAWMENWTNVTESTTVS